MMADAKKGMRYVIVRTYSAGGFAVGAALSAVRKVSQQTGGGSG